jgi:hypothetical protein
VIKSSDHSQRTPPFAAGQPQIIICSDSSRPAGEKHAGFLGVEDFRARGEPNVYLVLSKRESHKVMRSFLLQEQPVEIICGYKRGYGEGFGRLRYVQLHGVRHELL